MKKTYFFTVEMLGFQSVSGLFESSRSYSAEVEAVKIFMERNAIERNTDRDHEEYESMEDLIRFYAPTVRIATKADRASL